MTEPLDINALFLGPKGENYPLLRELLNYLTQDHADWRRDFHPDDPPTVTAAEQAQPAFAATVRATREALIDLAGNLQQHSVPWFSPRYQGHMIFDTLLAAQLGHMLTLLYNPNNCAYEGAPATTALEIEVGRQLARLMGYDPATAWGHVTSGGTVANYEGVWLARNLKSFPPAVQAVMPELVAGLDDWQLRNLTTAEILALADRVKAAGRFDEVRRHTVRGRGMDGACPGKLVVPQTKHYSWTKAADIFGLGQDHLVCVPVDDTYRMDLAALAAVLDDCLATRTPVLMVVAVCGTTEEGSVDDIAGVVALRDRCARQGLVFHLHLDAAYGGYARALFLDQQGQFMPYARVREELARQGCTAADLDWLTPALHASFAAMAQADSITVDPHKLGYVPYAAGAFLARDRRMVDLISYFAAYVFDQHEDNPLLLGSYILEGSKSGAAVAAVWMAHRVVPLDGTGYGRLLGQSMAGAARFYRSLAMLPPLTVGGKRYAVHVLTRPDLNIIDYAFREEGNGSLAAMNRLNQALYRECSYKAGPVYRSDFLTSKTALTREEYGDTPRTFIMRCGLDPAEWEAQGTVTVLRACLMTPYFMDGAKYAAYWHGFVAAMERALARATAGEAG